MSLPGPLTDEIPEILRTLKRPGDFFGAGEIPLPFVRISIDGVGPLGLPMPDVQAEALAATTRGPDRKPRRSRREPRMTRWRTAPRRPSGGW